ncbi:MAG: efflux RND transporter permease subunit [Deltaproteobacteria bacterium]|jgi:multidrug efflux pump|nr:efflux RND transporter permease subunit [Deltaproteobacteria bacterium]
MNILALCISRPRGTTLLTLAVALAGLAAFAFLPVAPLPQVDFPTIMVQASLPGASPETMAATVAAPLEQSLGRIAGVTEITSQSSSGSVRIILLFDLSRDIDGAARDVQAAINAARAALPVLPVNPSYWKMNPADAPIMIIGLTSEALAPGDLYEVASSVISQKISRIYGVGQVTVGGSSQWAVRVNARPGRLNSLGLSLEETRAALAGANANSPKGVLDNGRTRWFVDADDQLFSAQDFASVILRQRNGTMLRLADVAEVTEGVQDIRNIGYADGRPAVLLMVYKQPGANIIETIQRVRDTLPTLRAWMPASVNFEVAMDRAPSISASLREAERTLILAVSLVVLVAFLFLRNAQAAFIPAVAVPVSLLGAFTVMYLSGFSLNHLSLMALTIATGFVVDDAIVVTENIVRRVEGGLPPGKAALLGGGEVAFTVLAITLSLVAVFIPILGMGGAPGRLFREFAVTLAAAVLVSLAVSLSLTPMMCSRLLRGAPLGEKKSAGRGSGRGPAGMLRRLADFPAVLQQGYARSLAVVLRHRRLTLAAFFLSLGLSLYLYISIPKGFFPTQDTGQIIGSVQADQSISFQAMRPKMEALMEVVRAHPEVAFVGGFTGGGQRNSGMVFITLRPLSERLKTTEQVINELRLDLRKTPGVQLILQGMQDLRVTGRRARAAHQYTLLTDDLDLLRLWAPRAAEALRSVPGLTDVNSDQETRGLQTAIQVNRETMARLGVTQKRVDSALGLAFGQSFASVIHRQNGQYRVVLGFEEDFLQDAQALEFLYVPSAAPSALKNFQETATGRGLSGNVASSPGPAVSGARLVPLTAFSSSESALTALSVSHQSQFSATTISFNLLPGYALSEAESGIRRALFSIGLPDSIQSGLQSASGLYASVIDDQLMLIAAAILALYVVLGILYESLIHPLTILSTLPPAGVGALLGLLLSGSELTVIAFIGILLLFGIVKKNAIIMIDFAIAARRREGLSALEAIQQACLLRFRPIMMTSLAAMLGALPLLLGRGDSAELRTPLGITIVGGLLLSQLLTLYTTPVIYLFLDRFSRDSLPARLAALKAAPGPEQAGHTGVQHRNLPSLVP